MDRSCSIAEAKDQLSRLVHDAEDGRPVEITRRGRPVAVLLSIADYQRLTADRGGFWDRLEVFRATHDLEREGLEPDEWLGGIREGSQPREFDW